MANPPYNKLIDYRDFESAALAPYLRRLAMDDMTAFGLKAPMVIPDSKQWEWAMTLRTFDELDISRNGALIAGVGAGTEQTTFALASLGCVVFPTDRYLDVTPWSDTAPTGMMVRPQQYTGIKFNVGNVIPVHGDARALRFPSGFFDGVYSAGVVGHLGSLAATAAAAAEIGRILKPGGVASISTSFRLEGPNDKGWFDDNCILFTPKLLRESIIIPSALEMIDDPIFEAGEQTFDGRSVFLDFLNAEKGIRSFKNKQNSESNLVIFEGGFLFCSVHLALRKPTAGRAVERAAGNEPMLAEVDADSARVARVVGGQIKEWAALTHSDHDSAAREQLTRELTTIRSEAVRQEGLASSLSAQLPDLIRETDRLRAQLAAQTSEFESLKARSQGAAANNETSAGQSVGGRQRSVLRMLLASEDKRFVEMAYQTVLRRQPDDDGLAHHLARRRNGVPKLVILADFINSPEARTIGDIVPGLRSAVNLHRQLAGMSPLDRLLEYSVIRYGFLSRLLFHDRPDRKSSSGGGR